ncbi:MAG: PAS domain-containing protein [Chloroflexi bacterium]|nr:PAS domain-containing protein [Chloroflexota bacterium]
MNAADRAQLLRALHDRRETIAESWYKALASVNGFIPHKAVKARRYLVELIEQAIALLLTESFEHGKAREIGAALARLRYVQPEALGRTIEVLARQLVQGLPADQAVALQPRLAALLGGLAAGFFQQAREIILTEQEQIRDALISEILRAEEALRMSEETTRALLNAPIDPALLLDLDGAIVALNEAAAENLGRSASELVGTCVLDLFPPDVAVHRRNQSMQVIRSGKSIRFEDKRGEKWFDQNIYPVFNTEKEVVQLAVFARDITARKQAEAQAAQSNRLAAMGWLAAALAHEINNPLQAIQANLELAMDFDLEPDEHEKHLHIVRQEIERLAEITRRVLDFARPADATRYPVSIAHLIQKALQLVGKQLELAHIQVTTDLPADLPSVFVAPNQILQVLLNLSGNAIEAMPDGGHLHIAARAGENVIELALTNDGPPLPAEHIERIFDPFFTTKPNGAGLGLSISHSIVRRHGGTINVENLKDQRGVTLTVTLPIARLGKEQEVVA